METTTEQLFWYVDENGKEWGPFDAEERADMECCVNGKDPGYYRPVRSTLVDMGEIARRAATHGIPAEFA